MRWGIERGGNRRWKREWRGAGEHGNDLVTRVLKRR